MANKPKHAFSVNFKKVKICLLGLTLTLCFCLIIYRLLSIQVFERDFYLTKLNRQYEMTYGNSGVMRGEIYDRNGVELAVSVMSYSVYVAKSKIADIKNFSEEFSKYARLSPAEITRRINSEDSAGVFLMRKLEDQGIKSALFGLKKERKKGVSDAFEIIEETKRFYPYKELAGHVIGFADEDNEGLEGIEYFYNKKIKGEMEKASYSRDIKDGVFRRKKTVREGNAVELTLDKDFQATAEEELKKGVLKARAKSGFAVIMDPVSGEILAIASYPAYDPNHYREYSLSARKNRAVLDVMEPGSVLKVFLLAAALEERAASPSSNIYCENGKYKVHDRVFKEAHMKKFGTLTLRDVIKHSSNIGCIKMAEKLGKKKVYEYMTGFGFGKKTELGFTGESRGVVPTPKELTPVRLSTVSFGQGISVSPVQVTAAFCAAVNGGNLLKPVLVKRILNDENSPVWENEKEIVRKIISPKTSETVREVLREAVVDGTGKEANVEGTTVIGKTGTAQKAGKKGYVNEFFASFVGAFPMDKPKYVIYVGVDAPQGISYGGYVAAPIFREIAKKIIDLRGEERKVMVLKNDTVYNGNEAAQSKFARTFQSFSSAAENKKVPDLKGLTLREVLRVANLKKLRVEIEGTGAVVSQEPAPETAAADVKKIKVFLR